MPIKKLLWYPGGDRLALNAGYQTPSHASTKPPVFRNDTALPLTRTVKIPSPGSCTRVTLCLCPVTSLFPGFEATKLYNGIRNFHAYLLPWFQLGPIICPLVQSHKKRRQYTELPELSVSEMRQDEQETGQRLHFWHA